MERPVLVASTRMICFLLKANCWQLTAWLPTGLAWNARTGRWAVCGDLEGCTQDVFCNGRLSNKQGAEWQKAIGLWAPGTKERVPGVYMICLASFRLPLLEPSSQAVARTFHAAFKVSHTDFISQQVFSCYVFRVTGTRRLNSCHQHWTC